MADEAYSLLEQLGERPANREAMRRAAIALDLGRLAYDMRKARGLSQAQLALDIGTSRTVISRLEGGNAGRVPGLDQIQKIAEACGFEIRLKAERVDHQAGGGRPEGASFDFALDGGTVATDALLEQR